MSKTFHHAFKVEYPVRVRELRTKVHVATPLSLGNQNYIEFLALWDTGANNTVITPAVVQALNLIPSGVSEVHGVNSHELKNTYIVDLILPNRVRIENVNVIECNINGCDILIGMDIIQLGDFAIANANNKTLFSWCIPEHKNPIDLHAKSLSVNPKNK